MKLIVGLGNPGPKYTATRHNVGFAVVSALAERLRVSATGKKYHGIYGTGSFLGEPVGLLQPLTYMNRSGRAVAAALKGLNLSFEDVLVVYDDMDFPVGALRFRKKGSSGGHNGIKSIIELLGTKEFPRLRIGIDKPVHNTIDYVLGRFTKGEQQIIDRVIPEAVEGILCFLQYDINLAMNKYNKNIMDCETEQNNS